MNKSHRQTRSRTFLLFTIVAWSAIGMRTQAQTVQAQGPTLKSITVSPNPAIAGLGVPAQMHAIGTFSDGSQRDITSAAQWSASSGLTISPAGVFTAPFGSATNGTITATVDSVSGTANATVAVVTDSDPAVASIAVGQDPVAVAANPVMDKIYVANQGDNTVTVIDGATNATTTIPVCTAPAGLGVNSVTDQIYVACSGSSNVTVIDGATGNTATIATSGSGYDAVAVNSVTNQIFVGGNSGIVRIDGATNTAAPFAPNVVLGMGINTRTNTLYVANSIAIYVFDIASGSLVAIPEPSGALLDVVAVNQALNQVYFGSSEASQFLVVDGATNQSILIGTGGTITFNPVTNQVIAAFGGIQLYNAATNTKTMIPESNPVGWNVSAIDPVTNQVYLASSRANTLSVLDGRNGYALADTASTGGNPTAVAVNPVTDLVYVANSGTNDVTVISGASNATNVISTQADGTPTAGADPLTNVGYFAHDSANDLTVVNGTTGATTTVATGQLPLVTLVNPLTNQIYTLNHNGDNITVVNGATLGAANVPTGKSPVAGAINPFTNTVYASNTDGSLTVFDGNKNTVTNLSIGALVSSGSQSSMAMNVPTNQLYIADFANSVVDVLNGYTNAVTSYPVGADPVSVAVNPVTNLVYTANGTGQSVTVLNPATGTTATIPLPFLPEVLGVNTITNKIYAAGLGNSGQTAVATIDGVTNQITVATYPGGLAPDSMVVDAVTNRIYITSPGGQTAGIDGETGALLPTSEFGAARQIRSEDLALDPVHDLVYAAGLDSAIIAEEPTQTGPLSVSIGAQNLSSNPSPTFTLTAADELDPNSPAVEKVYYRFDTLAGPWTAATANADGTFTVTPSMPLQPGFHVLLAWAANGGENSTSGAFLNDGESPFISPVARLGFYISPQPSITVQSPLPSLLAGGTEQLTATELLSNGTQLDVTNMAIWTSSSAQVAGVSTSGLLTASSAGSANITASYGGLSGGIAITVIAPSYEIRALPIISLDASGNYVVQIALTNLGNTALSDVTLNLAELNSTAGSVPAAIPSLAVGATANVQVVFPASVGAQGSRGLLKLSGSYLGVIPGGTSQDGTFSDNYRIVLP